MDPKSVEIKVTVAGQVDDAVITLALGAGKHVQIAFFEDVSTAMSPSTPLLGLGVILRARRKSGNRGDATIKLRPCRFSQLVDPFLADSRAGGAELKIEADWAGSKRSLAASMTADWEDDRFDRVQSGDLAASELFVQRQLDFLSGCAGGPVNLAAITALPAFPAVRWDAFTVTSHGVDLSVRAERWTVPGGDDFLELSVVSRDLSRATQVQAALVALAQERGLTIDQTEESKTQRVLTSLIAAAAAQRP